MPAAILLLLILTVASHKYGVQAEWMFSFLENTGPEYSVGRIDITNAGSFR